MQTKICNSLITLIPHWYTLKQQEREQSNSQKHFQDEKMHP